MKNNTISLKPIAICHTSTADAEIAKSRRNVVVELEILEPFLDALQGIENYSHLIIIFWMHRVSKMPLVSHPRGDKNVRKTGAFAARGRNHPNPVGLAVTELLSVKNEVLTVKGLDAFDGTPVLDIKPYDYYDIVPDPKVPDWFKQKSRIEC